MSVKGGGGFRVREPTGERRREVDARIGSTPSFFSLFCSLFLGDDETGILEIDFFSMLSIVSYLQVIY